MGYAEVSVNSPVAQRRTFSYSIPSGLAIDVGQAVWVPFGDKLLQGIVLELSPYPAVEETKEIAAVIEPRPLLSKTHVLLARWLSEYYLSPLFDTVALMLPPGFERRALTFVSIASVPDDFDLSALTPEQRQILELVQRRGRVSLKQLEKILGKKKAQNIVSHLAHRGLVVKSHEMEKVKVRPKVEPFLSLAIKADEARQEAARLHKQGRALRQARLLEYLAQQTEPISLAEAARNTGCDKAVADALVRKGLVSFQRVEVRREPISYTGITPSQPLGISNCIGFSIVIKVNINRF